MFRKFVLVLLAMTAIAGVFSPGNTTRAQTKKIKIAFVPGTIDPFYQTMQKGVEQAAADLGVDVVTQVPQKWDVAVQTPIINALAADKSISALITSATDTQQLIPVLQAVDKAGIPVISVDTLIGDVDYDKGPVTFPLSYIGSDNTQGGPIPCQALGQALGKKGKGYIQKTNKGF